MKKELIKIIKMSGIDLKELVIEIKVDEFTFNSVELLDNDIIVLHTFKEELDIETYWDDISLEQQEVIINSLKPFVYN
jgi:hypothetical protein